MYFALCFTRSHAPPGTDGARGRICNALGDTLLEACAIHAAGSVFTTFRAPRIHGWCWGCRRHRGLGRRRDRTTRAPSRRALSRAGVHGSGPGQKMPSPPGSRIPGRLRKVPPLREERSARVRRRDGLRVLVHRTRGAWGGQAEQKDANGGAWQPEGNIAHAIHPLTPSPAAQSPHRRQHAV